MPNMKISVIGAGALGTFYAAMMAASGQDVTLVCRERDVPVLRKGIIVTGAVEVTAGQRFPRNRSSQTLSS